MGGQRDGVLLRLVPGDGRASTLGVRAASETYYSPCGPALVGSQEAFDR